MLQFHCLTDSSVGKSVGTGKPKVVGSSPTRSTFFDIKTFSQKFYIYIYIYTISEIAYRNAVV